MAIKEIMQYVVTCDADGCENRGLPCDTITGAVSAARAIGRFHIEKATGDAAEYYYCEPSSTNPMFCANCWAKREKDDGNR